jgi:hypothetical protein
MAHSSRKLFSGYYLTPVEVVADNVVRLLLLNVLQISGKEV